MCCILTATAKFYVTRKETWKTHVTSDRPRRRSQWLSWDPPCCHRLHCLLSPWYGTACRCRGSDQARRNATLQHAAPQPLAPQRRLGQVACKWQCTWSPVHSALSLASAAHHTSHTVLVCSLLSKVCNIKTFHCYYCWCVLLIVSETHTHTCLNTKDRHNLPCCTLINTAHILCLCIWDVTTLVAICCCFHSWNSSSGLPRVTSYSNRIVRENKTLDNALRHIIFTCHW